MLVQGYESDQKQNLQMTSADRLMEKERERMREKERWIEGEWDY